AGGAYVPLDPQYPAERLAFMLTDTSAPVLLTQNSLRTQLPDHNAQTVYIDTDTDTITGFPDTNPDHWTTPDHLAYVIYTSGSTGTPKGVMIQHSGVVNMAGALQTEYRLHTGSRILQFASLAFDGSAFEIYSILGIGGTVVLASRPQLMPGGELENTIRTYGINTITLPPSVLERADTAFLEQLDVLIVGGEASNPESWQAWQRCPRLINGYGPSEATVCVVTYDGREAVSGSVPIGRPVANTEVFVVGQADRLVPVGVPGELLVGGVGVGRGYLNRPELTAEKFVEVEIGGKVRRVYRTGDLVRWLPSGNLEFLGRIDTQVQVRGFRVEPGEIEARLAAHEDVASAVVDVREASPGDKRLTAYVVPRPGARPGASALRRWCADSLPDFMVPGAFMVLSELPLTPHGKVDRRALPAPDGDRPDLATSYTAPRDEAEATIAGIWARALGVDRVGIHDNFFDLGGHSLLATRVVVEARTRGFHLLPKDILKTPTVAGLATVLRQPGEAARAISAPDPSAPEIVRLNTHVPGRPTLFCVHEIGGGTSAYAHLAHQLDGRVNVLGIDVPADGTAVERSITEQGTRYLAAMRELDPNGPYFLTGWSFGGLVAMELARQAQASNLEVGMLAVIDSVLPSEQVRKRTIEDAEAIDDLLADIDGLRSTDEPNGIRPDAMGVLRATGVSDDILLLGPAAVESHLRIRKFQLQAMASFVPLPVDCDLRLYTARDNQWTDSLEAVWSPFVNTIEVSDLAGDHYTVMRLPSIGLIADDIVRHMASSGISGLSSEPSPFENGRLH
ncbi:amino acid adenylation domain-containing protein, partial [Streptomyces sp. NPDC051366]|uniref:amino acid adenylation domain-containing protein n=1 Tax=Streptomyces sp. NPDC051366 TaxID=3365652 RepID=UPI0037AA706B